MASRTRPGRPSGGTSHSPSARAARAEGLSDVPLDDLPGRVRDAMWAPAYPKVEAI